MRTYLGTITYNLRVTDAIVKFQITQAKQFLLIKLSDTGTLGGDTTSYLIESA